MWIKLPHIFIPMGGRPVMDYGVCYAVEPADTEEPALAALVEGFQILDVSCEYRVGSMSRLHIKGPTERATGICALEWLSVCWRNYAKHINNL